VELTASPEGLSKLLSDVRAAGRRVGIVPTMGALHQGHLSLVAAARRECDVVAATIFVNPLQFGPAEDFDAYPRDLDGDVQAAERAGVDFLFVPTTADMYPDGGPATQVDVRPLSTILEGASRPGHFAGVATVVTKLLGIAGPCDAYFGEKDYQQLVLVRRLVADLSLPARIVACPIVREEDGLALSSRNRRLSAEARLAAPALYRSLRAGQGAIAAGERSAAGVEAVMAADLATAGDVAVDYAVVRDAATLLAAPLLEGEVRLLVAAVVGGVRLIDNLGVITGR
jgi:pantoate--beta-alanine ligase